MPHLNGKGPDGKGSKTGRALGKCSKVLDEGKNSILGKGLGNRNKSGGGKGMAKRLKTDQKSEK